MRQEAMKSIADRNLIRQYLLGRLDEQRELEEQLSDGILNDEAMIDIADSVEDEIIEEYMDGSLNAEHKEAIEKYFLRPPQRQEKLRSAQLLEHYFETRASRYSATNRENLVRPHIPWFSLFRTYGALAALALVTVSTVVYVNSVRLGRERLANELAKEREHSSNLAPQAELVQPSIVSLTLVGDRSRGPEAQIPQIDLKSSTQRVVVEIALQHAGSGPYDVRLESKAGDNPMWSAKLLPIISSTGDARLVFDVPARTFQSDTYSFVVSSTSATGASTKHYDFQVKGAK
jgi:hypothetical protein